jgi:hypothetical protein
MVNADIRSGVKRPGREAELSPPSTAKVKNGVSYNSALLHASTVGRQQGQSDLNLYTKN